MVNQYLFIGAVALVFGFLSFIAIYALPSFYRHIYPWVCERAPSSFDRVSILGWYRNWDYRMGAYRCLMEPKCFTHRWLAFSSIYGLVMGLFFGVMAYSMISAGPGGEMCVLAFLPVFIFLDVVMRSRGEKYVKKRCRYME